MDVDRRLCEDAACMVSLLPCDYCMYSTSILILELLGPLPLNRRELLDWLDICLDRERFRRENAANYGRLGACDGTNAASGSDGSKGGRQCHFSGHYTNSKGSISTRQSHFHDVISLALVLCGQ
jgi:hypothetical protein